ncbi:hypothetical protein ACFOVU_27535, partial [Nocardiopsis sediminis]
MTRIVLIPSISFLVLWTLMTAAGMWRAGAAALSVAAADDGIEAAAFTADLADHERVPALAG